MKFYSPYTGLLVVRCDEAQHRNVWAAATLLTEIRRRVVTVRLVVLTGGKSCAGYETRGSDSDRLYQLGSWHPTGASKSLVAVLRAGTLECCKKKAVEYSGIVLPAARLSKQVTSSAAALPCVIAGRNSASSPRHETAPSSLRWRACQSQGSLRQAPPSTDARGPVHAQQRAAAAEDEQKLMAMEL